MASRTPLRPLGLAARTAAARMGSLPARTAPRFAAAAAAAAPLSRGFRTTAPASIRVGDPLPDLDALMEATPGNRVNLAQDAERSTRAVIIGVPAAFSPVCSASHVPSYISHPALKDFGLVAVVSVNDVFVMKAWGEALDPANETGIRFLADPTAAFTRALDLAFDGSAIFGGDRSKRYAIVVKDGKVESIAVEPDNTGTSVSMAEQVLGKA